MIRINDITYNIIPVVGTATPTYNITFSIPSTSPAERIRYYRSDIAAIDSGLHDPADESTAYSYEFTGLTESDIEGTWTIEWRNDAELESLTSTLTIPNSAVTSTTEAGGLDPVPSSVDITISGDNSPYVMKKVVASNFTMGLETFSIAAEYAPIKTYVLPNGARAVMLEVNDYVPSSFGTNREDWIVYSLIIENQTYQITPRNRQGQYPVIYHLNSPLVGPVRAVREDNNEGFIDTTSGKITEVGIKIELGRPEAQTSSTPIVFGYKLKYIDYD